MSFDTSRYTFDPWNNFAGVVMPQGRVQLDSDWNEWLAELGRRLRAGTLDIVGRAAVPLTTKNGFKIELAQSSTGGISVSIGQGRMYVDGCSLRITACLHPIRRNGFLPPTRPESSST